MRASTLNHAQSSGFVVVSLSRTSGRALALWGSVLSSVSEEAIGLPALFPNPFELLAERASDRYRYRYRYRLQIWSLAYLSSGLTVFGEAQQSCYWLLFFHIYICV